MTPTIPFIVATRPPIASCHTRRISMYNKKVLAALPKAELHVHMEGCLHPALIERISNRQTQPRDIEPLDVAQSAFDDIDSFMTAYLRGLEVLRTDEDFFDLVWDYAERAAKCNVVHVEMFFDPQAHLERGISMQTVMDGFSRAADRAREDHGMSLVLIMCFLCDRSVESAMAALSLALPFKHLIVGVGLDGDSSNNSPIKFSGVFEQAKREGFRTTAHCDIVPGNSVRHIREALVDLDVSRLDHASCLLDDPDLAQIAIKRRIVVTCCPETDLLFYGDRGAKKMRHMLKAGIRCTLNSDDPGYFGSYINENLEIMLNEGLSVAELVELLRFSIEGSWLEDTRKQVVLRNFDDCLVKFREYKTAPDWT